MGESESEIDDAATRESHLTAAPSAELLSHEHEPVDTLIAPEPEPPVEPEKTRRSRRAQQPSTPTPRPASTAMQYQHTSSRELDSLLINVANNRPCEGSLPRSRESTLTSSRESNRPSSRESSHCALPPFGELEELLDPLTVPSSATVHLPSGLCRVFIWIVFCLFAKEYTNPSMILFEGECTCSSPPTSIVSNEAALIGPSCCVTSYNLHCARPPASGHSAMLIRNTSRTAFVWTMTIGTLASVSTNQGMTFARALVATRFRMLILM